MVCSQEEDIKFSSVAVQVLVIVPSADTLSEKPMMTLPAPPVAVAAPVSAGAVDSPSLMVMSSGQVITGGVGQLN